MKSKEAVLTVREDARVIKKLDELSMLRKEKRSEIVREALEAYLKKQVELRDIKKLIAERYAKGELAFDDVVRLLGYDEARKISFYVELAETSFTKGLRE